ncbi:MAG: class F sortase [bacterium]|nr:class F sortase [bacterium]
MNTKYKKLVFFNLLFLAAMALVIYEIAKPERIRQVVVPVPEDIYIGEVSTSTPIRVYIPNASIDGNIVPVGKGVSGNMAVPVKYEDIGWYKYGPVPGQLGNSVLAGHVDDGKGNPAIFYKLKDVKVGDFVYTENNLGEKIKFVVKEIKLISYDSPTKEDINNIFGKSETEGLNLITCDGTWIPEAKTYSNRLVVFTERVLE